MTSQREIIRRRVALLAAGGLAYAAGSTTVINGPYQKNNGQLRLSTAGQSSRPFEVVSSGNRPGPAGRLAR